jgi:hypothetical protein
MMPQQSTGRESEEDSFKRPRLVVGDLCGGRNDGPQHPTPSTSSREKTLEENRIVKAKLQATRARLQVSSEPAVRHG